MRICRGFGFEQYLYAHASIKNGYGIFREKVRGEGRKGWWWIMPKPRIAIARLHLKKPARVRGERGGGDSFARVHAVADGGLWVDIEKLFWNRFKRV